MTRYVGIHTYVFRPSLNTADFMINFFLLSLDSFNDTINEVNERLDKTSKLNDTLEKNTLDIKLLKVSVGGTMFKMVLFLMLFQ